jgi:hypothetical protein
MDSTSWFNAVTHVNMMNAATHQAEAVTQPARVTVHNLHALMQDMSATRVAIPVDGNAKPRAHLAASGILDAFTIYTLQCTSAVK